jgi:pimeloyl-ACP methyl ester carboxylesterase
MRSITLVVATSFMLGVSPCPAQSIPEKAGLPFPGETLAVSGRQAFLIVSQGAPANQPKPWVLYAPTLNGLPSAAEKWMFQRFLDAGIAIAGIDVGESYGNPQGRLLYSSLHQELTHHRGYSTKPVLLARSRGGLMTLAWAADNPDKVAAWAGIYPVTNIASYPGVARAASAYNTDTAGLIAQLTQHNPIDRLKPLADARIPLFAIHGDSDKLVPLDKNSGIVKERYTALGASMQLVVPEGQGHNMWPGFFECQELVDFVKKHAAH